MRFAVLTRCSRCHPAYNWLVTTVITGFSLLVSLTTNWGKHNQAEVFPGKPDRMALNSDAQLFIEHIWSFASFNSIFRSFAWYLWAFGTIALMSHVKEMNQLLDRSLLVFKMPFPVKEHFFKGQLTKTSFNVGKHWPRASVMFPLIWRTVKYTKALTLPS